MDAKDLRTEIIECQKSKVDLLKWKLILTAGLGAAGLGAAGRGLGQAGSGMPLLWALVPLVCAYVDIVCYHNDLRIMVIAQFLRSDAQAGSFARAYEQSCQGRRHFFLLENFAMYWGTLALSILVALGPWVMLWMPQVDNPERWAAASTPLTMAGCVGLMASAGIRFHVSTSVHALEDDEGLYVPAWTSGWFVIVTVLITVGASVGLWRAAGQCKAAGILVGVALIPVALVAHRIHALRRKVRDEHEAERADLS